VVKPHFGHRELEALICELTGARGAGHAEVLQTLWSGYGQVTRHELDGGPVASVVVKRVTPPKASSSSHARKLKSYAIEATWYQRFAPRCDERCRVARCYGTRALSDGWLFVFEDLEASGFGRQVPSPTTAEVWAGLDWLAAFHATHLGTAPEGLWKIGSYWHLETRLDELPRVANPELRRAAPGLAHRLNSARTQTLVHGDAKLDNFLFSEDAGIPRVAAVDFQYVGRGCGMRDVAYFLSSVYSPEACEREAPEALARYFAALTEQLRVRHPAVDRAALEAEWRQLYPVAWADFQRFLEGWAPGVYDGDPYAYRLLREALAV